MDSGLWLKCYFLGLLISGGKKEGAVCQKKDVAAGNLRRGWCPFTPDGVSEFFFSFVVIIPKTGKSYLPRGVRRRERGKGYIKRCECPILEKRSERLRNLEMGKGGQKGPCLKGRETLGRWNQMRLKGGGNLDREEL